MHHDLTAGLSAALRALVGLADTDLVVLATDNALDLEGRDRAEGGDSSVAFGPEDNLGQLNVSGPERGIGVLIDCNE